MILFQRESTAAVRVFGELPLLFPRSHWISLTQVEKGVTLMRKCSPSVQHVSQLKHDSYVHVCTVHQHDNARSDTQIVGSAMKYSHLSTSRC